MVRSGLVVYPARPLTALTRAPTVRRKRLASAVTPTPEPASQALTAASINIGHNFVFNARTPVESQKALIGRRPTRQGSESEYSKSLLR